MVLLLSAPTMVPRTASGPAALLRRRLAFVPFQHAHPCRRLYSTPLPTPGPTDKEHTADHPPPPLAAPKKPRLDLRPAPIKPKPPSSTPAPKVQSKPTQAASALHVPTLPSLGAAKEEAKHDIREAEAHGVLEPPPEGATWLQRTLHQVIQIAKFYYRGTKLIFTRRKAIAAITARVRAGGEPLTRAEFRLITTQKDDITKLVPFLVIALLLEEVIPLIAIYAPFMLPSTCILPSQRARIDAQRAEKARAYAVVHAPLFAALAADARDSARLPLAALARPDAAEVVCGCLGLSTIGPNALRLRRIRRHLSFIVRDDEMLLKDTAPLSRAELVDALEERGIRTSSEEPYKALQAHLLAWLDAVRSAGPDSDDAVPRRLALVVKHAEELVARP